MCCFSVGSTEFPSDLLQAGLVLFQYHPSHRGYGANGGPQPERGRWLAGVVQWKIWHDEPNIDEPPTLMAISMGKIPTFRHHNWSNWRSSLGLDSRQSLSPKKTIRQTQSISRLFHMQISEATLSSLDHPQEDAQFVGRPSMMLRFLQLPRWCDSTRTERLAGHCTWMHRVSLWQYMKNAVAV